MSPTSSSSASSPTTPRRGLSPIITNIPSFTLIESDPVTLQPSCTIKILTTSQIVESPVDAYFPPAPPPSPIGFPMLGWQGVMPARA